MTLRRAAVGLAVLALVVLGIVIVQIGGEHENGPQHLAPEGMAVERRLDLRIQAVNMQDWLASPAWPGITPTYHAVTPQASSAILGGLEAVQAGPFDPATPVPDLGQHDPESPYPDLSPEQVEVVEVIREVFGPQAEVALDKAWCESRFMATAEDYVDGTHIGVFQIWKWHLPLEHQWMLYDARFNIIFAYYLSGYGLDWGPWVC